MSAHYLRAITDWCIVFGADSNEVHWKQISSTERKEIELAVRPLIYNATGFTEDEWSIYRKKVTDFRNKYASHRNVNFKENVPSLDKALEIAKSYFEWLKELLRPAYNEPKPLEVLFPEAQIEVLRILANDLKKKNQAPKKSQNDSGPLVERTVSRQSMSDWIATLPKDGSLKDATVTITFPSDRKK